MGRKNGRYKPLELLKRSGDQLLAAERFSGHIEYKWRLVGLSEYKKNKIVSQMQWRIRQNPEGVAFYVLGIQDNGRISGISKQDLSDSYTTLLDCVNSVGLGMILRVCQKTVYDTYWAVVQVFKFQDSRIFRDDCQIIKVPLPRVPRTLRRTIDAKNDLLLF